MKNSLLITFILFGAISCRQQHTRKGTVYLKATERTIPSDSLFSGMNLIYLEESDSLVVGAINKIIKNESAYYLLDSEKSKSIFAYNGNGKCIAKYYARGGGPKEYTSIMDFDIDTIRDEVVILCAPAKLIIIDLRLSFKKEISLDGDYYDRMVVKFQFRGSHSQSATT